MHDLVEKARGLECGEHFACKPLKDNQEVQCCLFNDRACTTRLPFLCEIN